MTDYSVYLSARSRRDLNGIQRWLTQPGSGLRARLTISRITRALTELQFAPYRWPMSEHPGVRQRLVEGHTVIYRIDDATLQVRIIRIFGPGQNRSTL